MNNTIRYEQRGEHGPALVFLHGIGGDASCWWPQLDFFSPQFRTIAWNMPGYGGSRALTTTSFSTLADALAQLLDELELDQAHIVGHSLGGMIAQEFVAAHPERVHTLVLSGTSAAFGKADGAWQNRFLAARLDPLDQGATMAELAPGILTNLLGDSADPHGVQRAITAMSRVPESAYRAALACLVGFDRRENLPRIPVPTLLLAGEKDNTAPPLVLEKMANRVPQATYICLPNAGHIANLEQPRAFNDALQRFLQQHQTG